MNLTVGLYTALAGDGTLTALLNTYRTAPGIFTSFPIPADATFSGNLGYIVAHTIVADLGDDDTDQNGRMVTRDIHCFTKATGSVAAVEAIAERVRTVLHRNPITVSGFKNIQTLCQGPVDLPTDDTLYGRLVTAQFLLHEN